MIVDAEHVRAVSASSVLPLDQLRVCGGSASTFDGHAVYFLWLFGKLQYIGQTSELWNRVVAHIMTSRFPFNRMSWCEVEKRHAIEIERDYILAYRPPFNLLAGGNITTKGRQWVR